MTINKVSELPKNCKDITGQRFGRLVALEISNKRKSGRIVWRCVCDCGNECFVRSNHLCLKAIKSCGCLKKERCIQWGKSTAIHGMRNIDGYYSFQFMISRCENPKDPGFKNYGGRGITISEEFHDIKIWYNHIGPRPGSDYSQERIDNEGNYERGNIKWATRLEQNNNKRDSKKQYWFFAYNENTGEWDEDNNQRKFAKRHDINSSGINHCLSGLKKQHRGWIFQRIQEGKS